MKEIGDWKRESYGGQQGFKIERNHRSKKFQRNHRRPYYDQHCSAKRYINIIYSMFSLAKVLSSQLPRMVQECTSVSICIINIEALLIRWPQKIMSCLRTRRTFSMQCKGTMYTICTHLLCKKVLHPSIMTAIFIPNYCCQIQMPGVSQKSVGVWFVLLLKLDKYRSFSQIGFTEFRNLA